MERDLYKLSKFLKIDRIYILKCLEKTGRIHRLSKKDTLDIVIQDLEKLKSPPSKIEGPSYEELVIRARQVGLQGFINKLEKSKGKKERKKLALEALKWIENPELYTETDAWEVFGEVAPFVEDDTARYAFARLLLKKGTPLDEVATIILQDDPPTDEELLELFKIGTEIKRDQLDVPKPKLVMQEIGTILWNYTKDKKERQTLMDALMG